METKAKAAKINRDIKQEGGLNDDKAKTQWHGLDETAGGFLWEPPEPHLRREFRLDKGRCVRCNAPAEAYLKLLALGREATKRLAKAEGMSESRFVCKPLCTACRDDVDPERRLGGVAILDLGACARCQKKVSAADRKEFDGPILTLGTCDDCGTPVVQQDPPEGLTRSTALVCQLCIEVGGRIEPLDIGAPRAGDCYDFRAWVQYRAVWEHDEAGGCRECAVCIESDCKACPGCLDGLGRSQPSWGARGDSAEPVDNGHDGHDHRGAVCRYCGGSVMADSWGDSRCCQCGRRFPKCSQMYGLGQDTSPSAPSDGV